MENAGHSILSESDREYKGARYRKLCFRLYKIICSTKIGKVCASDHALNAIEEMSALNEGLKEFFQETGADCPTYHKLEADAGKYLIGKKSIEK